MHVCSLRTVVAVVLIVVLSLRADAALAAVHVPHDSGQPEMSCACCTLL